jgi:hypothetical protein
LWFPGRLFLRVLKWDEGCPGQGWIALAASIVLVPIPLSWIWRYSNSRWAVLIALLAVNLLLLALTRLRTAAAPAPRLFTTTRSRRAGTALALFVGGCVFGTLWLPQADGRLVVQPAVDYAKHHAVLYSLDKYPLPLHNVFYAAEKDTPYYYHEYHHLLAAALRKLTGEHVSIAFAFATTSALTAMAFVAVTFVLAREFLGAGFLAGAGLAAAGVSVVGGWDIVPVLLKAAKGAAPLIILDSWSPIPWRLHNLMTQYMWCPQHVAAMLAVMLAARWLRLAPWSAGWIWVAPLVAASVFGSSVYLAMTVFASAAIYVLARVWRVPESQSRGKVVLGVIVMALLGAALMAPQAAGYREMAQRMPGGLTTQWDRFEYAFIGRLVEPGVLANWLDAPWILLIDFGLAGGALILASRKWWAAAWRDDGLRLLMIAGAIGTVAALTVRSHHSPLDYSFRIAIMPAQVLGAICVGALLQGGWSWAWLGRGVRFVIVAGVVLGLPVGFYEAPMMALRTLLRASPDAADAGAARYLREHSPADVVVQGNPVQRWSLPQLIDRQMGVTDDANSHVRVFYPKDMAAMKQALQDVREAFTTDSAERAYDLLRLVGVDYILAGAREQALYGPMPQLDNRRWFECVYRDDKARVYRLRKEVEGPAGRNRDE